MSDPSIVSRIHAARKQLLSGNAGAALHAVDETNASGFATYHLVRAECLYAQHNYVDAKRESELALGVCPNSARARILLELVDEMLMLDRAIQPTRTQMPPTVDQPELSFPKSSPPAPEASDATDSTSEGLVSETLANILVRQGKYAEARKIYIQLSRLHPDRDAYFHEKIAEMDRMIG